VRSWSTTRRHRFMSGSDEKEARAFNGTCSFGTAGVGSGGGGGVQLGNSMMSDSKKWMK